MPDTPSITIIKSFSYRGVPEEFSNTYHFSGTMPADRAAWLTLGNAIWSAEASATHNGVTYVRMYGYEAGTEHSIVQIDSTEPGWSGTNANLALSSSVAAPGDTAATIRWFTGQLNSRGKKIYCRKYMHGVRSDTSSSDKLYSGAQTAYATFAGKMIDGTLPGGVKYCGPQGAVLSAPVVNQWLTTRTLKRRGKRPLASG